MDQQQLQLAKCKMHMLQVSQPVACCDLHIASGFSTSAKAPDFSMVQAACEEHRRRCAPAGYF